MHFPKAFKGPKVRLRRPRIRIRWRKSSSWWAVGVAVAFFASLFALHVVLMQHAESIVRDILDSRVRQATEGFYSTSFDHIEVNYANRDLIIHNFRLYPDSSLLISSNGKQIQPAKVYDVLIPEMRIEGINLKKAYLQKELEVKLFGIIRPEVNLYINLDLSVAATDSLKQDINKRLAPFFNTIEVKKLLVSQAKVSLQMQKNYRKSRLKSTLHLETGNLLVKTAAESTDQFWLQLERFVVQSGPVVGYVSDETYLLKLRSITASSADSSFYLQGLQLLPMDNTAQLIERDPELERIYTIQVPQLYAYGLDFDALYNQKNFVAGEITFLSPTLELFDAKPREEGEKENFKPEDLYPLIEKILNQVSIDQLFIRHGKAQVRNQADRFITRLNVDIREASVYNFVLDSAAQYRTDKLFFSDSVRMDLRNYQLRLSDNLHLIKADELQVNSNTSRAYAGNLRLEPDTLARLRNSSPVFYHVSVPVLSLVGIDMPQLYNNNRLTIDSLMLKAPELQYTQRIKKEKSQVQQEKTFRQQDLYGLVSDYLYQLNINQLAIDGGRILVSKGIKEDNAEVFNTRIKHAYLWNLQIDSSSAYQLNKLFYADNFDLEIADYRHKLPDGMHAVEARTLGISTLQDRIIITGIKVLNTANYAYPFKEINKLESATLMNIHVPYLELTAVDILKSYLSKRLEVGEVVVPNATVHLGIRLAAKKQADPVSSLQSRTLYSLIEDFAEVVHVQNLRLSNAEILTAFYAPNGLLQLNSQKASVSIENFRFDAYTSRNPKRLFFADAVSVSAQDFIADLPDERYQLRADWLGGSTSLQQISAEGVQLIQPNSMINEESLSLQGKKGILSFSLPLVEIKGVDFDKAYYEDYLHVDSIIANAPSLNYYQLAGNGKKSKKSKTLIPKPDLYESLAPFFEHLSVGTVQLKNGTIKTAVRENGTVYQNQLLENISIAVSNFKVDSAAALNTKRFFYSEDIQVHIGEYSWLLPDKVHRITASNLDLSTLSEVIRASSVKLAPIPGKIIPSLTPNRYLVEVPEIIMVGLPFDDIFEKDQFKLKRLEILNPSITIRQYSGEKSQKEKPQKSLPELLSAGLNLLQIDEAVLSGGSMHFVQYGQAKPRELHFPQVSATLTNFSISPHTVASSARPFFADNLVVQLDDWKRMLPDSVHWLEAGTIRFSARDSLLLAQQLQVYPDVNMLKQSRANQSLIHANVPQLRLEGFAYDKLSRDTLWMKNLWISDPIVQLLQAEKIEEHTFTKVSNNSAEQSIGLIKLDSIQVTNGTFVLKKAQQQDTSRFELNHIYVKAANFQYDSIMAKNKDRILFTDKLEAGVKNYKAYLDNGFYEIEARQIAFNTERNQLWADSLRITPAIDKNSFAKQKALEIDQLTFRLKRLSVDSLDLKKLFHDKTFEADKVSMVGLNLYIYRDKRQPFQSVKRPKMPQEMLRNSSWNIMVRETEIKQGYIAYAERVKGAREDGFIDLTNFNMHADTISNYPKVLESGYVTNMTTTMDLMGNGHLEANFAIPFGDTTNHHSFYGSLESMQLSDFNPILEKTSFISIRSGLADRIEFHVIADSEVAEGTMEFEYNNLRVALVNKRTGRPGGLIRRIGSGVANMFVHSSNTIGGKQEQLRTGEIEVKRDEKRSTVNYWIKTLIGGFKSSIGI